MALKTERRRPATLHSYHSSSNFLIYSVLPRFTQGVLNTRYCHLTAHIQTSLLPTGEQKYFYFKLADKICIVL
jgi:hypothetical protein